MFSWLKKYLIPHHTNDYKPHLLRHESTILVLFLIMVIELVFLVQVFVVFDKTNFLASVLPGVLTTITNEERAENNASPLVQNELLTRAAQLKATDMATNGYFAHTSPDGKTPWYWLDQVGYKYNMAGENLAVNFFESRDVAEAWMNSPSHRANIVKKNYKEIGIGVATGKYEGVNTVFVAQFFGTPIAQANIPTPVKQVLTQTTPSTKVTSVQPKTAPIPKPPVETTPVVTPQTVANTAPTSVQVLGEETTTKNIAIFSSLKSFIEKVLTSPREYVSYIYSGIALFFILILLLAIFIKREFQHPALIARGLVVVFVLVILTLINIKIFSAKTEIPTENLEASVIAY